MTHRILFVCLGNICRSPTAEGVFQAMAAEHSAFDVTVDSAGTSNWHIGDTPYDPMQKVAHARGYDLSDLRARQFTSKDFDEFDLIIGMDDSNLRDIEDLRPSESSTKVALFTDYMPNADIDHVPDPYYTRDFDETLDIVEAASRGLISALEK